MKKKRIIQLANPRLRKIRLGFRQILLKESKKRLNSLLDKEHDLLQNYSGPHDDSDDLFIGQLRSINDLQSVLRNELSNSIVVCGICRDLEGDRVYNPRDKAWYCPKCFDILEKSYEKDLKGLMKLN